MVWLRRFFYLLLGVLALAVCVVLTMPLRFALDHAGAPPGVSLAHVRGNLVEGRAGLLFHPPPGLPTRADVGWRWCPGLNPVIWCLEVEAPPVRGKVLAAWSPPRALRLSEGAIEARLERQPLPLGRIALPLSANLRLALDEARFAPGGWLPQSLRARVAVEDVATDLFSAGDFQADLASDENGGVAARVRGGGELFRVNGDAALAADLGYRYQLDVDTDNDLVRDFLAQRGQANDKGGYRLSGDGGF